MKCSGGGGEKGEHDVVKWGRHATNSRTYFFFTGPLLVCWISDMAAGERKGQVLEGGKCEKCRRNAGRAKVKSNDAGRTRARVHAVLLACTLKRG